MKITMQIRPSLSSEPKDDLFISLPMSKFANNDGANRSINRKKYIKIVALF